MSLHPFSMTLTYILCLDISEMGQKVEAWLAGLNAEDDARTRIVGIDVSKGK